MALGYVHQPQEGSSIKLVQCARLGHQTQPAAQVGDASVPDRCGSANAYCQIHDRSGAGSTRPRQLRHTSLVVRPLASNTLRTKSSCTNDIGDDTSDVQTLSF